MNNRQTQGTTDRQKKPDLDKEFLPTIQPQGGIRFRDKYIKKGDVYEAGIHVRDYPSNVNLLCLDKVMSMYDVTLVADVATMEQHETISAINKSMVEHDVRFRGAKQESDRMDAQRSYQEMEDLYQQISEMGEVIKLLHIRLFVASPTIRSEERRVG